MIKTRVWLIIIGLIFAVSLICAAFLGRQRKGLGYVNVYVDKTCVYSVSVAEIDFAIEYTVKTDNGGYNTVKIEKDKVSVSDANCSDKVCVKTGYIHDSSKPIICLPHKVIVRYEKTAVTPDFDSVIR